MREITSYDDFIAEFGRPTVRKAYDELKPGDRVVLDGTEREVESVHTSPEQAGADARRTGSVLTVRFVGGTIKKFQLGAHGASFDVAV